MAQNRDRKFLKNSWMALMACAATMTAQSADRNGMTTTLIFQWVCLVMSTSSAWWSRSGRSARTRRPQWARSKSSTWQRLSGQSWWTSQPDKPKSLSCATSSASSTSTAMVSSALMSFRPCLYASRLVLIGAIWVLCSRNLTATTTVSSNLKNSWTLSSTILTDEIEAVT